MVLKIPSWIRRSTILGSLILAGCSGTRTPEELRAYEFLDTVSRVYWRDSEGSALRRITPDTPLEELLAIAVRRSLAVGSAYSEWEAEVQDITVERSLSDPRVRIEADIQESVMSLIPGLMLDVLGPGRLRLKGKVAAAEADVRYEMFRKALLESAAAFKQSYYELQAIDETLEVAQRTKAIALDMQAIAKVQHGAGRASFQDVLRSDIELEELEVKIRNLRDNRAVVVKAYVAALGFPSDAKNLPALPRQFSNSEKVPPIDAIYSIALERNPTLARMSEELRLSQANLELTRTNGIPDVGFDIEVDIKSSNPIVTPLFSMTLSIWRDKRFAQIAAAEIRRLSSSLRKGEEEIRLGVDFSATALLYRENERMYRSLTETLIPKAKSSLEIALGGYASGQSSFVDVLEAKRTLLQFELSKVEARKTREFALASLSLTIAGISPVPGINPAATPGVSDDQ